MCRQRCIANADPRIRTYNKCGRTYLFDIDFHHLKHDAEQEWEPKYVVDAYHSGNVRFHFIRGWTYS
jgi:hypothetical protein